MGGGVGCGFLAWVTEPDLLHETQERFLPWSYEISECDIYKELGTLRALLSSGAMAAGLFSPVKLVLWCIMDRQFRKGE